MPFNSLSNESKLSPSNINWINFKYNAQWHNKQYVKKNDTTMHI